MKNWNNRFYLDSPLFTPIQKVAQLFGECKMWPSVENYNEFLATLTSNIHVQNDFAIHFITQEIKAIKNFYETYEARIYLTGKIPTRPHCWHDFLNGLCWVTFPKIKLKFNQLQYDLGLKRYYHHQQERSHLENTLAQLDESGMIVIYVEDTFKELLIQRKWVKLFYDNRDNLQTNMQFYVIGHGLYQQLLNPFIGLTGKAIILKVDKKVLSFPLDEKLAIIDEIISTYLDELPVEKRCKETLTPVPVLGIPYCYPNQTHAFYLNTKYFRPLATSYNIRPSKEKSTI